MLIWVCLWFVFSLVAVLGYSLSRLSERVSARLDRLEADTRQLREAVLLVGSEGERLEAEVAVLARKQSTDTDRSSNAVRFLAKTLDAHQGEIQGITRILVQQADSIRRLMNVVETHQSSLEALGFALGVMKPASAAAKARMN